MNSGEMTRLGRVPARGDIWLVDLGLTEGHEQAGKRPAVVISANGFNQSPAGLVTVLPMTSVNKGITWHVEVAPPEGNLRKVSYVMCDQVRSVSVGRLVARWGEIGTATLAQISGAVQILLDL